MLRPAGVVWITCLAFAAHAQGWETFSHDLGAGAAVCPYDNPETGAFFCFAIACETEGTAPMFRVAIGGEDPLPEKVPLQVLVDGKVHGQFFLTRLSDDGMQDFGVRVRARHADLLGRLRNGSTAKLIFGAGLSALVQDISLAGSQAAIDEVSVLCQEVQIAEGDSDTGAGDDEPDDGQGSGDTNGTALAVTASRLPVPRPPR